jgi:hypothetical protein
MHPDILKALMDERDREAREEDRRPHREDRRPRRLLCGRTR